MLGLTTNAVEAITGLVASHELPDGSGLFIAMRSNNHEGLELELSLAQGPRSDEQVISHDGANVFLDPDAAPYLDDKLLDAEIDEGRVSFTFNDQQMG